MVRTIVWLQSIQFKCMTLVWKLHNILFVTTFCILYFLYRLRLQQGLCWTGFRSFPLLQCHKCKSRNWIHRGVHERNIGLSFMGTQNVCCEWHGLTVSDWWNHGQRFSIHLRSSLKFQHQIRKIFSRKWNCGTEQCLKHKPWNHTT